VAPPKGTVNNPKGGPSIFKPEFARIARKMVDLGATDLDLAEALGVSLGSIRFWRGKHPEFAAAVATGKDKVDDSVERSLLERARGYTYEAERIHVSVFEGVATVTKVPYLEHVAPDVTAQIFWLKNRRRDVWRDRTNVDLEGEGLLNLVITGGLPGGSGGPKA
jgi:hypothetical protein